MRQAMDVKELAEFIGSFYDRNTGTFPKGPEGVVVMVGKKFGEQAEQVARKFVERMAPHQEAGAEQMQELARIRELAGMPGSDLEEKRYEFQRIKFRGTDHDVGEERYAFAIGDNPLVFNFSSDEDNPDPDSPSFEEILARVQRDGAVEHFRITPEEQRLIAKKIETERRKYLDQRRNDGQQEEAADLRIRDISPEDDEDDEEPAERNYAFDLGNRLFDENPNLSVKRGGDEVVDAAYEIMIKELGKKRADYILRHDEDFVGDLLDMYSRAQYSSKSKEEAVEPIPELEDIRRLSGIAQGLGY
jgi:hypothetical protein